jgi:T5orf172 domain.
MNNKVNFEKELLLERLYAMSIGYVYVLYNPAMEGMVKIGRTTDSSETRAAKLSRASGVSMAFLVVHDERVLNCEEVEKRLHARFANVRVGARREFFRASVKSAVKALQEIAAEFKDTSESKDYLPNQVYEMLPRLRERYAQYIRSEIKSVKMVHKEGLSFLEITSQVNKYLKDERTERIDLSFIYLGEIEGPPTFSTVRSPQENAEMFIQELDPYSIIMCTPLFTEAACREIAGTYERNET